MKQSTALKVLLSGANTFLTGEPGAGKTHTINLFTESLRSRGIQYAVTASTGIAATHIGGVTIHSWSGIGIKKEITDDDLAIIESKAYIVNKISNTKVLIIDEISMLSADTLNNVEKVIAAINGIMANGEPWGGLQVVFVGDFYQLPPVSKEKDEEFCFNAEAWKKANVVTCYLTEQHRQNDPEHRAILTRMRNGLITAEDKKTLLARANKDVPKTILFTHNKEVDSLNSEKLIKMEGKQHDFYMTHTCAHEKLIHMVDMLKKNCISPEKLSLKKGALVMFTRNNFDEGYVNGTIGTVVDFHQGETPIVEIKDGKRIYVERAKWSVGEGDREIASIRQYPLRLAWAITVHKSQGMSLDSAQIDLGTCFEYGQGYVAISRVCNLEGLYLKSANPKAFMMHPDVVEQDKVFRASSDMMEEAYKDSEVSVELIEESVF